MPTPSPDALSSIDSFSKPLFVGIALASLATLGAVAWPLFLGDVYSLTDLWGYYLPLRSFYATCLASGDSPLWCPLLYGGYDMHGAGQACMFHPLQYLMYRFLPLFLAIDFEILVSYPVMFAGMYLFLRRWSLRVDCALFGAMLYTFSTFNMMRMVHPNALQAVAHFPWVLYFADLVARAASRRTASLAAVGLGLLNASLLLLGYPQYFWFASLLLALYGVFLLALRAVSVPRAAMVVAAVGLGVAAGCVQLLPTIDALEVSVRKLSPDWSQDEAANAGSVLPRYLLQAVSPYTLNVSHKQRIYMGAVPLLLVVWAAARWRAMGDAKPIVAAALILSFVMAWITLGEYGYLYAPLTHLPIVGGFRYPSRYMHLMGFGTAICGAYALADVLNLAAQRARLPRLCVLAMAGVVAASVLVTALAFRQQVVQVVEVPAHVIAGSVLLAVAAAIVLFAARGFRWAALALVALAVADPAYYALPYSVWNEHRNLDRGMADLAATMPRGDQADRLMGGVVDDMDNSLMLGWRRMDGFEGLAPYRRLDYRRPNARRAAGIGWISRISQEVHGFVGGSAIFATKDFTGLQEVAGSDWLKAPDPLPRARMVTAAQTADDLWGTMDRIDVAAEAIVEEPIDLAPGTPGVAKIVTDRPGAIDLGVQCDTRQLLVVSEAYDKGWEFQVDGGSAAPALRVYNDFMGCVIEPGDHEVSLRFRPRSFRNGLLISIGGVFLLAAWASVALLGQK